MSAKKYFGAFCLYLNYLVHGIGVLVMSLNVHEFEVQWQTDAAGVSVVISSLGLGRLALLVLAGSLSDKYGRRPFVLLGTVTYLAFFIGLLFTHDVGTAYFFGLLAGAANSLLDAGTYPRLMELFPKAPGPAVILVKAFVAAVFGGIGSIPGAFIGGILLGIIEILGKAYISSQMADAIVFAVLIIVLLVKPTGLLGKNIQEKV